MRYIFCASFYIYEAYEKYDNIFIEKPLSEADIVCTVCEAYFGSSWLIPL